eukprot:1328295-Amphidinium_carterae.1
MCIHHVNCQRLCKQVRFVVTVSDTSDPDSSLFHLLFVYCTCFCLPKLSLWISTLMLALPFIWTPSSRP